MFTFTLLCYMGCFQSRKRLYNHKCPFVGHKAKPFNSLKSSSFIIHLSSFIILHSSFIILHHSSSFFIHPSFISRLLSFSACFITTLYRYFFIRLTIVAILRMEEWNEEDTSLNGFTRLHLERLLYIGWSAYILSGLFTLAFYKVHPR